MSDADNQMGGSGGETGPKPSEQGEGGGQGVASAGSSGRSDDGQGKSDDAIADEASEESFPASDPPANY